MYSNGGFGWTPDILCKEYRMSLKSIGLLAALLSATAVPVFADSYTAFTNPSPIGNGCSGAFGGDRSSTPVSAFVACGGVGYSSTGSAASTPGAVHAAAQTFGFTGQTAEADFTGSVTFGSSVVGSFTPVQFVMPLDGFFTRTIGAITSDDDPNNVGATTAVNVLMAVDGGPFFGFNHSLTTNSTGTHDTSFLSSLSVLSGNASSDTFVLLLLSPVFQLETNVSHRFTFILTVSARSFGTNEAADADFSNTFGFEPGFTPFILADGVTANAGDYIVNNVVVGPNAPVPEPASWALMLVGFGGLGAALRSRRRAVAA